MVCGGWVYILPFRNTTPLPEKDPYMSNKIFGKFFRNLETIQMVGVVYLCNMKKIIRLTESDLVRIIERVINEGVTQKRSEEHTSELQSH